MIKNRKLTFLILLFLLFVIPYPKAQGQQTIISVPSSEVIPFGDMIIKGSNRFSPIGDDKSINMTPSLIFGTGGGTEASIGASTAIDGGTVVRGDFAIKKVFYIKEATRLTLGGRINPYFTGENTADTFVYTHITHRIRKTKTSLTAGAYAASRQNYLPNHGGALIGLEQVIISNKLRVAVDWISSDRNYGNFGIGLKYRPVPTLSVTTAVIIPNKETESVAFNVSLSKFISLKDLVNKKGDEI